MEPKIYKPSIYKGAGIYNIGAGGGGGEIIPIHQTFVNKNILGKNYKCIEIDTGIFWPVKSLDYIDENIVFSSDLSLETGAAAAYYDYTNTGDYLQYNQLARQYINTIKTQDMKNIDNAYFSKLMNYIQDKINSWLGYNVQLDNTSKTTFVKDAEFNGYENWLGLLDIGLEISGSFDGSNWTKYPYGYPNPVYFGLTTSPSNYGEMINLQTGKDLAFYAGSVGNSKASYPMRFFIDEN